MAPGQAPSLYTAADGWKTVQIQGMGIAGYDLAGNGKPDYFLTSQADNRLQQLTGGPGQPAYQDIALQMGVTSARPGAGSDVLPSTSWHPEFQDVNNDGLIDLLITKGNPSLVPEYASRDPSALFLGKPDGTFVDTAERPASWTTTAAGGRQWPTSTSTASSISWRCSTRRRPGCGATWGPATRPTPRRWAIGWTSGFHSRPRTRTRSERG
jgi:hypothetical protein